MRSLWMSSCNVTLGGCKSLAKKMPMLNVEIINETDQMDISADDRQKAEKMFLYRTLAGRRKDAPEFPVPSGIGFSSTSLPSSSCEDFQTVDGDMASIEYGSEELC
ncbi:hypothetical protein OIU85_001872 [Salix viminalis]|uniref:Uncharacterized protein n=1 Tax=Salix viminalis TaxID=40686 RepID=A0A9Q0VND7_SALVM|nr:hypothetical protein OIU85_001872 [Salix viminalis]